MLTGYHRYFVDISIQGAFACSQGALAVSICFLCILAFWASAGSHSDCGGPRGLCCGRSHFNGAGSSLFAALLESVVGCWSLGTAAFHVQFPNGFLEKHLWQVVQSVLRLQEI